MTENILLDQARQVLRGSLLDAVAQAELHLREAQERLRKFDEAMGDVAAEKAEKVYQRGRTILVRNAINAQEGREFTPDQILVTIHDKFPNEAWLTPHVTDVTKVLIKLAEAGTVSRVKQGAGLKPPVYQQLNVAHIQQ